MAKLEPKSFEEMMKFLECPICLETMYPPIFQCTNGHTFCPECRPKVGKYCAVCHVLVTGDIRSFALERFLSLIRMPCVYNTEGCTQMFAYKEKLQHEKTCKFRPFKCLDCTTMGSIRKIVAHLRTTHKVNFVESDIINFKFPRLACGQQESRILTIHKCMDGCYFLLGLEAFVRDGCWFCLVYLTMLGEEKEAEEYRYVLRMGKGNKRATWEGEPSSCRVSKQKTVDDCDGLLLYERVAQYFLSSETAVDRSEGRRGLTGSGQHLHGRIYRSDATLGHLMGNMENDNDGAGASGGHDVE